MKIERIILILVLVGVIFVATIVMFVYKTFSPGSSLRQTGDSQSTELPQLPSPVSTSTGPSQPNETDSHNALDDCIELKANQAKGLAYERGSLLVTFFAIVDYELAIKIISLLDLRTEDSLETKERFNQDHWIRVLVPAGTEFKWQCILEGSEGIKRAGLNPMFVLRQ